MLNKCFSELVFPYIFFINLYLLSSIKVLTKNHAFLIYKEESEESMTKLMQGTSLLCFLILKLLFTPGFVAR
jgi:hypothetical protein